MPFKIQRHFTVNKKLMHYMLPLNVNNLSLTFISKKITNRSISSLKNPDCICVQIGPMGRLEWAPK